MYEQHRVQLIGTDQSLRNRYSFEHRCLNNIKRYINMQVSVMTKKKLKYILDADMVSTKEEIKYDSPSLSMTQTT